MPVVPVQCSTSTATSDFLGKGPRNLSTEKTAASRDLPQTNFVLRIIEKIGETMNGEAGTSRPKGEKKAFSKQKNLHQKREEALSHGCVAGISLSSTSGSSSVLKSRASMPMVPMHVTQLGENEDNILDQSTWTGPNRGPSGNNASLISSRRRSEESISSQKQSSLSCQNFDDEEFLCSEICEGFRKNYYSRKRGQNQQKSFRVVDGDKRQGPIKAMSTFFKSYVLPEGFPESVTPAYVPYMQWRAVQYFFGGAMSVFTTRSLLHSLGMSRGNSTSGALAVNWVIKDGAGRIGKMLFARHGKKFDCDLKQFRFGGALLMELGAGVELATMAMPKFFLPLACAANVAKNIAAVTATSTRAPIYKAFARRENIGDVTAKGESVSNLADLLGTGLGILLSRKNPSLVATFCLLSCGYLCGAYQEVRSVQVPTLNRARFAVAVRKFLETGNVPSLSAVNFQESIVVMPWAVEQPLQLGVRVLDAFSSPAELKETEKMFQNEKYLVTYRPDRRRAFVVLKAEAEAEHVLQAAFQAHVLLHILHKRSHASAQEPSGQSGGNSWLQRPFTSQRERLRTLSEDELATAVAESCCHTRQLFETFRIKAAGQGWTMKESLLNPGDVRFLG